MTKQEIIDVFDFMSKKIDEWEKDCREYALTRINKPSLLTYDYYTGMQAICTILKHMWGEYCEEYMERVENENIKTKS